jgi:poly(A) polymerase
MKNAYDHAVHIVKTLKEAGFIAYFAGGWVRDHVMGHDSDDIDIATNAPPLKILELFPRTLAVGLAFGVVIVMLEEHQFEVATFRTDVAYTNGRKPDHIVFSGPMEDALRRDFTINGMFYDPLELKIYDFVGGMHDIHSKVIRTIGDPYQRFMEDRLRMVRAFRFSTRFDFHIDLKTQEAIRANADTLFPSVAMERIWQELSKMSRSERFDHAIIEMFRLDLLTVIFPQLKGEHLNEFKDKVSRFSRLPAKAPTILYLSILFPKATKEELFDLCFYLRTGGDALEWMRMVNSARLLMNDQDNLVGWAHFLASEKSFLALKTALVHRSKEEAEAILQKAQEKKEKMRTHIERIVARKPLVSGKKLREEGVSPGKAMGFLIKEAEKIAIEQDIHEAFPIIQTLKNSPLWKNGTKKT